MIILEDTRNQVGKHQILNDHLTEMGHKVMRSKLLVGDYTNLINQSICVDTKKDILELVHDVASQDHKRFVNECKLANQVNIQLIILIEEIPPYRALNQWVSPNKKDGTPFTKVKGETLEKILKTLYQKYKVRFVFCSKESTAKVIVNLLGK